MCHLLYLSFYTYILLMKKKTLLDLTSFYVISTYTLYNSFISSLLSCPPQPALTLFAVYHIQQFLVQLYIAVPCSTFSPFYVVQLTYFLTQQASKTGCSLRVMDSIISCPSISMSCFVNNVIFMFYILVDNIILSNNFKYYYIVAKSQDFLLCHFIIFFLKRHDKKIIFLYLKN